MKKIFTQGRSQLEIFLNNNPKCSVHLENVVKGEKWNLINIPSITVKGSNFDSGKKMMEIIFKDKILAKAEINIVEHDFVKIIELPSPLENPQVIEVKIGTTFHQKTPVKLKRLYGTVTYFDGTPVSYPIIITASKMAAIGDEKGNFEIYLHGKEKSIGIFEKNYSKSTLECWLYDVDLKEDIELNVRIDKLEVYELGAWKATTGVYIHFIPMSLTRILKLIKKDTNEFTIASHPKAWPHLSKNDVKVYIDEEEVPISTFNEYDDFIGEYKGKKVTRPGYILGISRRHWHNGIIKVEIKHHVKLHGKEILEKGEGFFFGFIK